MLVGPPTSAEHAVVGIAGRIGVIPAPLPHIPQHVEEAERIRLLRPHGLRTPLSTRVLRNSLPASNGWDREKSAPIAGDFNGDGRADLAILHGAGLRAGWRLVRVRPLDFFPHTPHLETVFTLERAG